MMGASLCGFRQHSSSISTHNTEQRESKAATTSKVGGGNNISSGNYWPPCTSVILNLIRRPAGELQTDQRAKKRTLLQQPADDHLKKKKKIKRSKVLRNKLTLEEWLLASPGNGMKPDRISGGELHVFRHYSRKVFPSSKSSQRPSNLGSKVRDSFYLEPVLESTTPTPTPTPTYKGAQVIEVGANYSSTSTNMSRSRSGKLTKKVRFREEPDIIIIYSPEEQLVEK